MCVCVQLGRFTKDGQLFLGPLGSTGDDTRCVVDDQVNSFPQLLNCDKVTNVKQKTWHFSQVRRGLIKKDLCLTCACVVRAEMYKTDVKMREK